MHGHQDATSGYIYMWHHGATNKILLIPYPYKVWIYRPQTEGTCLVAYLTYNILKLIIKFWFNLLNY
jgi:hypothetical protein